MLVPAKQQIHHINPFADPHVRDRDLWRLGMDALNNHLWVLGAPGVGKTAAVESAILWPLFYHGHPCLVMDPVGTLSRRLIWRIGHYPRYLQPYLFDRLVYVARGAPDYVVPTPLYAPQDEQESPYATANRLIQAIARADPFLVTASIEGLNALKEAGLYAGQLAAAAGLQVSEVADMLVYPDKWLTRLAPLVQEQPLLRPAFAYLAHLKDASPSLQARKTGSFLSKVLAFLSDPLLRAPYAAGGPGLNLAAHVGRGDTVIFDYSYLTDRDARQFAMLWDFLAIAEWAKRRGMGGREQPCLWCIDEVSALTNLHALEHSILGEDINEQATQYARNVGLQLCLMNQTVSQLPPAIVSTLSQFGTKLVGNLPLREDALWMAQQLHTYDPHLVRKRETVWANDPIPEYQPTGSIFARANHIALDERTSEYTIDEQYELAAQAIQRLPAFHFVVKAAQGEGHLTGPVRTVAFTRLVGGLFPDAAALEGPLTQLRRKWGVPIAQALAEIEQRKQPAPQRGQPAVRPPAHAILSGDKPTHAHPDHLSAPKRKQKRRRPAKPTGEPRPGGDDWQQGLWTG